MAASATFASQAWSREAEGKSTDWNTIFNTSSITPAMKNHIQKVYLAVAASLIVFGLGAYVQIHYGLGGALTTMGTFVSFLGLIFTPISPQTESLRLSLLLGTSFFKGCSLGPLVHEIADMDSSLIASAVVATAAIFVSFTGAALLAKRREYLYLGGVCGSALTVLLGLRLASFLFGTHVLQFQLELYAGLLIFSGYVIFDTQVMMERAAAGSKDYVSDALQLWIDFIAIFVRILIILSRNQERRRDNDERRRTKRR